MSFIAVAIIGGAVIAGGATAYASSQASKSQRKASRDAAAAQVYATDAMDRQYHQSRGSEGSAFLAEYAKDTEAEIFRRARDTLAATSRGLGSPEEQYLRAQADLAEYEPQFQAGTDLVGEIYSGEVTDRQLAAAKPVMAARTAAAAGQKTSLLQAVQEVLNRIKAQSPGAAGTFAQKMQLNALAPGLQAAANVEAQAAIDNAEEEQAIRNMRDTLGLQYLNVPLQRAREQVALRLVPTEALAQAYGSQVSPLSLFNIGVGKPPQITPLPTAGPIPGIGQIVASGVGQLANTAGNYYANHQYANRLNDMYAQQAFYNQRIANPNYSGDAWLRANSVNPNAFPGTYQTEPMPTFQGYGGGALGSYGSELGV